MPSSFWVASTNQRPRSLAAKAASLGKSEGGLCRRVIAGQKPACIAGWGTWPPRSWQGNEHTAPKSGWRMALAFVLLAVAAGGALPFQAGINARLATFIGGRSALLRSLSQWGRSFSSSWRSSLRVEWSRPDGSAASPGGGGSAALSEPGMSRARSLRRLGSGRWQPVSRS